MNGLTTLFLLLVALVLLGFVAMTTIAVEMTRRYGYEYADENPVVHLLSATRTLAALGVVGCLIVATLG